MAGYVVVRIDITDTDRFKEYQELASQSLAVFGGRFLVRGGAMEILEGSWDAKRMVLLEFESLERAKEWYHSPEYRKAIAAREGAATFHMLAMEGL